MTDAIVSLGNKYDIKLRDDTTYKAARIISKDDVFIEIIYEDKQYPVIKKTTAIPLTQVLMINPVRDKTVWFLEPQKDDNLHNCLRRFLVIHLTEEEIELSLSEGAVILNTEDEVKAALSSLKKEDLDNGCSEYKYQYQKEDGAYASL